MEPNPPQVGSKKVVRTVHFLANQTANFAAARQFEGVAISGSMAAMPRIEHVALWVRDLDLVCDFYVRHFGATPGSLYQNTAKGFTSRFLTFADGARLELMTSRGRLARADGEPLGLAHLAISLGSESAVDALTAQLKASGVPVLDGPRRTGDGYYESVVLDPEGNRLELTA